MNFEIGDERNVPGSLEDEWARTRPGGGPVLQGIPRGAGTKTGISRCSAAAGNIGMHDLASCEAFSLGLCLLRRRREDGTARGGAVRKIEPGLRRSASFALANACPASA